MQICSEPLSVGDQAPSFSLRRSPRTGMSRPVTFMRCSDQLHQAVPFAVPALYRPWCSCGVELGGQPKTRERHRPRKSNPASRSVAVIFPKWGAAPVATLSMTGIARASCTRVPPGPFATCLVAGGSRQPAGPTSGNWSRVHAQQHGISSTGGRAETAAGCHRRPRGRTPSRGTTVRSQSPLTRYCPVAPTVDSDHQVMELSPVQPLLIVSSAANGVID